MNKPNKPKTTTFCVAKSGRFWIKNNAKILALILFFYLILYIIVQAIGKNLWWDSFVYVGIGKYLLSFGNSGLFEVSRPLVLPFLIGILWKLGLNAVIAGRLLILIFSMGTIVFTYLVAREIFDCKVALLSAAFIAFSSVFFEQSFHILTGIPSTFFVLAGVYFFLKQNYLFSGLFAGISFMTRFLQLGVFIVLMIFVLFSAYKLRSWRNCLKFLMGFAVPVLPYLVANHLVYGNFLHPFILQIFLARYTGWEWSEPASFYFINLFKDNFLVILGLVGLYYIYKNINYKKFSIAMLFLVYFIFLSSISHKEARFMVVFLPYLYTITSFGFFKLLKLSKKFKPILILLVVLFIINFIASIRVDKEPYQEYGIFQDYLKTKYKMDGMWISNPAFLIGNDKKAEELIYYPSFNEERVLVLRNSLSNAKHILINTCDLKCNPDDISCPGLKKEFVLELKSKFNIEYEDIIGDCDRYILVKP